MAVPERRGDAIALPRHAARLVGRCQGPGARVPALPHPGPGKCQTQTIGCKSLYHHRALFHFAQPFSSIKRLLHPTLRRASSLDSGNVSARISLSVRHRRPGLGTLIHGSPTKGRAHAKRTRENVEANIRAVTRLQHAAKAR